MSDDLVDFKYAVNSVILSYTTLKSGSDYVSWENISSHIRSTPQKWSKLAQKMPK
jgi:hypothetical protein